MLVLYILHRYLSRSLMVPLTIQKMAFTLKWRVEIKWLCELVNKFWTDGQLIELAAMYIHVYISASLAMQMLCIIIYSHFIWGSYKDTKWCSFMIVQWSGLLYMNDCMTFSCSQWRNKNLKLLGMIQDLIKTSAVQVVAWHCIRNHCLVIGNIFEWFCACIRSTTIILQRLFF